MMIGSDTILSKEICRKYIEEILFRPSLDVTKDQTEMPGLVGAELESFPYRIHDHGEILPVQLYGTSESLMNLLMHYSALKRGVPRVASGNDNTDVPIAAIDFPDGSSFHFEPGAQIEISTAPCDSIGNLGDKIHFQQEILHEISNQSNFRFVQCGTNPWFSVEKIGLQMNKTRYRAMSRYFDSINPFGRKMMLQTCSLQINISNGADWNTLIKRFLAANLLVPFATALFANSPAIAENKKTYKSYRSFIWQQLDKSRTGLIIPAKTTNFDKGAMIEAYLRFALKAPIIFIENFGDEIFPSNITMEYWIDHPIKGLRPTLSHWKNHLSLLFPEVRVKGYLELRSIDAPPPEWQMVAVLFYCGLLYPDEYLDKTLHLLLPFESKIHSLMEQAVFGLESDVIFKTAAELMNLALKGFAVLPEFFRDKKIAEQAVSFFERYTKQRMTFADNALMDSSFPSHLSVNRNI